MGSKKSKRVLRIPLPHNYTLVAPRWPAAAYCDKARPLPPPESYPTLEEAVNRIYSLLDEVARASFDPPLLAHIPAEAITVKVRLFDDVMAGEEEDEEIESVTPERIIEEFRKHPSVPIIGEIYFWESRWDVISTVLQGQREVQEYLQSPEAEDFKGVLRSLGAVGTTGSGIVVEP